MNNIEIRHQINFEVRKLLAGYLNDIKPEIIKSITESVSYKYDQKLYEQQLEINELKDRINELEEVIAWAQYKFNKKL